MDFKAFLKNSYEVICQQIPWVWGETLMRKAKQVRYLYRYQETPRQTSPAEEFFVFWLFLTWGNKALEIASKALAGGNETIEELPPVNEFVSYEEAKKTIPNLTSWEFQHIRPMVGIYAQKEMHPYELMYCGLKMIRIGQMGFLLKTIHEKCGDKKIRIPIYSDEEGAKVVFLHQGKWRKAQFYSDKERE